MKRFVKKYITIYTQAHSIKKDYVKNLDVFSVFRELLYFTFYNVFVINLFNGIDDAIMEVALRFYDEVPNNSMAKIILTALLYIYLTKLIDLNLKQKHDYMISKNLGLLLALLQITADLTVIQLSNEHVWKNITRIQSEILTFFKVKTLKKNRITAVIIIANTIILKVKSLMVSLLFNFLYKKIN